MTYNLERREYKFFYYFYWTLLRCCEGGEGERVLVPVRLLGDPCVAELLDMAARRYGYRQPGVLRVPCDAGHFRRVLDGAVQRCGTSSD